MPTQGHFVGFLVLLSTLAACAADSQTRPAAKDAELKTWLQNMTHHRYTPAEMRQVTGLTSDELQAKLQAFGISPEKPLPRTKDKLFVLPYPGGRHPRIGFLEGAIDPQRETKLSVFCPWDDHSYAVLDVPEAIWSNLGLTYLAHTHIDTVWTKRNIPLQPQEWKIDRDGAYVMRRRLPNGIEFGTRVLPLKDHLRMEMWLKNGSDQPLRDLRVQNCVMLKGVDGFQQQDNDNKRFVNGYAIAKSPDASRWIITAWDPVFRAWGNGPCPCLHSDPKFPDCPPGETKWLRGWFSFFEGQEIDAELTRIERTGWRNRDLKTAVGNVQGRVHDSQTGQLLPCRLYVQNTQTGTWHFAEATSPAETAIRYDKQQGTTSIEKHTTLSQGDFQLSLPAGQYRLRVEHGKEFMPVTREIVVGNRPVEVTIPLARYIDMGARGWYSGDTHVHRSMDELPNLVLAEDVNVVLPLNYWVRDSREIPATGRPDLVAKPQQVDTDHIIYPINTEYEIFTVNGRRHTQGAVFVLNHQEPLRLSAPPTRSIAAEARRQGALLDLDKQSWNWSLMIVPIMKVDLFELSNNHHWRTDFAFSQWTLENAPASWQEIERNANGFTEKGWTDFGFLTYYALLNCGYRMRVSAGTASGVHPVPLGHGRVYVHTGHKDRQEFRYRDWIEHLNAGHSFVTQGPLLDLRFNGQLPGTQWTAERTENSVRITGEIASAHPLRTIEVIVNGRVTQTIEPQTERGDAGSYHVHLDNTITLQGTSWLAVRCYEELPQRKVSFAHTNPVYLDVSGQPLRPQRREVEYFIQRMDEEIQRNTGLLPADAVAEFQEAKAEYQALLNELPRPAE